MSEDICGSENTTTGEPCQWAPGDSCPYHDVEDPPDMGRPSKLTKQRQEAIASAIEQGESITGAARMNGIHPETFYNWMQRGEQEEEGPYADFFERLTRARGYGEHFYVEALVEMAKDSNDTAALMSMLKQRYPETWGNVDRGEQAGGVQVYTDAAETTEIDPETLEEIDSTE